MKIENPLTVYLPDTRGVAISRYGLGNTKIGSDVFTFSRLPGMVGRTALGLRHLDDGMPSDTDWHGTCPGATDECQRICYAARPVKELGPVSTMWLRNSGNSDVPPIPKEAKTLRIHVSGDFDTVEYIENWITRLTERPDVTCWAYTRSWRVPTLLPSLERLRALPNVQLFASMDKSHTDEPPTPCRVCGMGRDTLEHRASSAPDWVEAAHGFDPNPWRRAWIDGDPRAGEVVRVHAHTDEAVSIAPWRLLHAENATKVLVCPEETKAVKDCQSCGFCFDGGRNDVLFLEH